jgi:DNA-binding SARP family transcriptional activator
VATDELLALAAASRGASQPTTPQETHGHDIADAVTVPARAMSELCVHVSLFGSLPTVRVRSRELDEVVRELASTATRQRDREGLRRRGREILAFLALRPEGATTETLVTALWPEDDPDAALVRLRRDIDNVRDVLRRASGLPDAMFIVHRDERYRLNPVLVDTDIWEVERALAELPDAGDRRERCRLLERAVGLNSGQLLEHASYEWVDPGLRENFSRRVVDAAHQLSKLREEVGDVEGAAAAAERAIAADPDCEELYRRLMMLQVRLGRPDAARRTLRVIEARLADVGAEPEEETVDILSRRLPHRGPS